MTRQCPSSPGCPFPDVHILYVGGEDHHLRLPAILGLVQRGFRVTAAGSGDAKAFAAAGVDFRPFSFDRFLSPLSDIKTIHTLRRVLLEVQPDIAQSFDSKLSLLLPIAARTVKEVLIVRTINGRGWIYSSRSLMALALRPVYQALHRAGAPRVAATLFEIDEDKTFFQRHRMVGSHRCMTIPGAGVDVEGFSQALLTAPTSAQLRESFGLGDAPVVITVTRMTRQKGIPTLLKAAALIHKTRPEVRFLLVGPRESEGAAAISKVELEAHAPYVMSTGPRDDVPALLRMADVFAFPTEYREGIPRVILEAALAGLPTVTTSIAGCSEVIKDGWSGLLVPPHSADLLAARILTMLNDREAATKMAARALTRVQEAFSLDLVVSKQAALYSELVNDSASIVARSARIQSKPMSHTAIDLVQCSAATMGANRDQYSVTSPAADTAS